MLLLAVAVIALAVPFGTALTLDRRASVAVAVQPAATAVVTTTSARRFADAGTLMVTGWLLIGLAAAVRRTA
jgi:hypothetical protein